MPTIPITTAARPLSGEAMTKTYPVASWLVWIAVLMMITTARADDLASVVVFHPGETMHLVVAFKDSGITFDSVWCRFSLQGQQREGQKAFSGTMDLNRMTKIPDREREYELSGTITDQVASGDFSLEFVIGSLNGLSRRYNSGADFSKITIRVENPKRVDFPDIKTITLKQ